jgi:hypothetical protein
MIVDLRLEVRCDLHRAVRASRVHNVNVITQGFDTAQSFADGSGRIEGQDHYGRSHYSPALDGCIFIMD